MAELPPGSRIQPAGYIPLYVQIMDHIVTSQLSSFAIAFVVTTCYPMQVHPGRGCVVSLVGRLAPARCLDRMGGTDSLTVHVIVTSLMVAGSLGVALVITKLGKVLGVLGAVCSSTLQFILPGGCYYILFPEHPKRWLALFMLVLGLVVAPLCLTVTFI